MPAHRYNVTLRIGGMGIQSIAEASEQIRRGKLSPVDLVRECLRKIENLNPALNAFITVTADSALVAAENAKREINSGNWRGPLHGIPIGLKDLIDTAGVRTTAASAIFRDRIPAVDADLVAKLRAAGAIVIGKQNLHEFAYGGSSVISHFGPVRNPVNPDFIAGGSSGGSAAAVASGMCLASIGTDTAGSIREPAALCGVVGLKPSHALVSTRGVIPLSTSLDHAGPITRTVEDAAILLEAVADLPAACRENLNAGVADLRIGIPRKYFFDDLDSEIAISVDDAIQQIARHAKSIHAVECPVEEDRTVFLFESHNYHRDMVAASPELYNPETLRRVKNGAEITESAYQAALRQLQSIRSSAAEMFNDVDILLTPTVPVQTPCLSDLLEDITKLRPAEIVLLRNTRPVNVWGVPAVSIPCGVTSQGMPIGLQIIGPPGGEPVILRVARFFERNFQAV